MSNTNLLGAYGGLGNSGLQFRNKIINGDMRIHQRGSLATPITNTASAYVLDRFWVNPSGGSITISQESAVNEVGLPAEFSYYQKLITNTGDNYASIIQKVEDVRTLAGQTVTFSFWAKGTNPGGGQFSVRLNQAFNSSTTDVTVRQLMVITSSWKKYSFTFNLDAVPAGAVIGGNSSLWVIIEQPQEDTSTAAWTLDTTGWQLEAGPVATPFEHRPVGLELQLAQRYYEKSYDLDTAPGTSTSSGCCRSMTVTTSSGVGLVFAPFKVTKRVNPANTVYTAGGAQGSLLYRVNEAAAATTTASDAGEGGVISASFFKTGLTANARFYTEFHWTADAEL